MPMTRPHVCAQAALADAEAALANERSTAETLWREAAASISREMVLAQPSLEEGEAQLIESNQLESEVFKKKVGSLGMLTD